MKLFIIEDEVPIRQELTQFLEKYGFQCESSDEFHGIAQLAFVSKPYNAQVLLVRIQKLLSRDSEAQDSVVLTHKGLTFNLLKAEISYNGQNKKLTKNEMGILRLLMVNKGNIIPRDAIIDDLWQSEEFIDENTLNVNIVRLRKTLAEIGLPDYLETKRGLGYLV